VNNNVKSGGSLIVISIILLIYSILGYSIEARLNETYHFESNSTFFRVLIIIGVISLILGLIRVIKGFNIDVKEPEQIKQEFVQVRQKNCPKCGANITFLAICPKCGHVVKIK